MSLAAFRPLLTLFSLCCTAIFLLRGSLHHVLGAACLCFAYFKLLDLTGFANRFRKYNLPSKHFPIYASLYPFIEMACGCLCLLDQCSSFVMLFFLSNLISTIHQMLATPNITSCACMGTSTELPVSYLTCLEDFTMFLLAVVIWMW